MTGAVDQLLRLGFQLIAEPEGTILVRYPAGSEPPDAQVLLGALRTHKAKVLAELNRWDDARARLRLEAAFDRADKESPSGCWVWCNDHDPELVAALKKTLHGIDEAFREENMPALVQELAQFETAVRSVRAANSAVRTREPGVTAVEAGRHQIPPTSAVEHHE